MVGTRETGNETYVVQLASALAEIGGYEYRLYTPHPEKLPPELGERPGLRVRAFPNVPSFVRIPFIYPRMAREDRLAILHMTYIAPPVAPCPVVLTVHDVSYRIYPQFFSPRVRLLLGMMVGPSIRRATRVITVSESAKQDIVRFYRVSPKRVAVTPEAAGPQYGPQAREEIERVHHQYRLGERYVLAVGNVQPRKNLPRLVEAFGTMAEEVPDVELVIAGRSAWRGSEVEAAVERAGLAGKVRFVGYVPDRDLPALYAGAAVFCYPSLYEGFGLPPLEAMQCGTPTVTSNVASLPEVVGDAALTVDPESVQEMAAALRRLLTDEGARQEYREKGLARAKRFSWERTARLTRDVYDEVLATSRKAALRS
jgi:glycosyltransferase involved in cell wall biosynthesis